MRGTPLDYRDEDLIVPPTVPSSLLVIDDHRVFAEALVHALSAEPTLEVVGMAHTVGTGIEMAGRLRPDLVAMDVRLGDGDGVAATAELTRLYPDMCVVVLTGFVDPGLLERVAAAGASALLPKDGELGEMTQALRTARRGRFLVHPTLLRALVELEAPRTSALPPLTGREPELLRLIAAGLDIAGIAHELDCTVATARAESAALLLKLGARTHLDAIVVAMRNGLLRDSAAD